MSTKETASGNDIFTDENFPQIILNRIWSYLISEAPFDDGITLTCKAFRDITYKHPSHASRFHFRLEPLFRLNNIEKNHNKFQIGAALTEATRRAIIVPSVKDAITDNPNATFPFKQLKVFNVTESCQLKDVIPFFEEFKGNIKFMSWNSAKFLNQDLNKYYAELEPNDDQKDNEDKDKKKEELIPAPLTACTLFSLITRRRWHDSINLNGRFPNLLCLAWTIEWYTMFDLIQQFFDSHSDSIAMLHLDFNFNLPRDIKNKWAEEARDENNPNPTRLKLKLPKNLEICVLSALNAETAKFIDIDFSECRHKLKQLVCLMNTTAICNPMFLDGKGNKNLQYLVINDMAGIHNIKWDALKIGTNTINKIDNIYLPCTPQWANKISASCIGEFPDLESVKECIENVEMRRVLRDLNCEQRRHYLWGLFWHERHGIGMKKLKILETEWKRQASVEYF